MSVIVQVKEQTHTFLKNSMMCRQKFRNCTKLVLKPLAAKNGLSILVLCIAPFLQLYSFSLLVDYPPRLYTAQYIYIAALPLLIKLNQKWCSKSKILTMDHELVLENPSLAAVNTLLNTIIYLKAINYLNIRLRQIY